MHEYDLTSGGPSGETRLDLDHYLLWNPQTQRVRFTRSGQHALAARLARSGVDIRRLRTLDDVETAIARVTTREYHRLTPAQQDDEAVNHAIDDLCFITDAIQGRPSVSIEERRQRMAEGIDKLFAAIGITLDPA